MSRDKTSKLNLRNDGFLCGFPFKPPRGCTLKKRSTRSCRLAWTRTYDAWRPFCKACISCEVQNDLREPRSSQGEQHYGKWAVDMDHVCCETLEPKVQAPMRHLLCFQSTPRVTCSTRRAPQGRVRLLSNCTVLALELSPEDWFVRCLGIQRVLFRSSVRPQPLAEAEETEMRYAPAGFKFAVPLEEILNAKGTSNKKVFA